MSEKPIRHLLGLSGGKDSAALAIYMRDRVPDMEYFFADTGAELPETLEFIERMEDYLGKEVTRLKAGYDFDHYLKMKGNFLPNPRFRWCTQVMKLQPFEEFVGEGVAVTYVGIRADEPHREGYLSRKPNITARYPFKDDGLNREDIVRILDESGLGLPEYYRWRSRSGCYFCFFQRKDEWIGLYENHPDLFKKAMAYEEIHRAEGRKYTWSQTESLASMLERRGTVRAEPANHTNKPRTLLEAVLADEDDDPEDQACPICSI